MGISKSFFESVLSRLKATWEQLYMSREYCSIGSLR